MQLCQEQQELQQKINHKYIRKKFTTNPSYNIKLGTFYFKQMLKNLMVLMY